MNKKIIGGVIALLVIVGAFFMFSSDSHESLMKDSISLMEDVAETWEDVDDKDSFKEAEADMKGKFKDAQEDITDRGDKLEEGMSDEDIAEIGEEMMEKYGDELQKVTERMIKASMSAATKYAN
ncbi:MAG: hypothetical protein QF856_06135 [Candidatus Marinimicrobia bacterium]|jgi:uncharacterized protein YeeX (DUF496 family)|nr:hypothetical protein [Candidatus Neomarinimicrobiota bacterium]